MVLEARDVVDGRFVIERVAATGGMGTIYRAYDREIGDYVALKVLKEPKHEPWRSSLSVDRLRAGNSGASRCTFGALEPESW